MNVLEMQQSILIMAFAGHICYQKCVLFGLLSSHFPHKIYILITFLLLLLHFLELDSLEVLFLYYLCICFSIY